MHRNVIFEKILTLQKSNFEIDLDGSKYDVISVSAGHYDLFGGAKEVQDFKVKVHSGPEGSRGLDYRKKEDFCHKFHLEYLFTSSLELVYTKNLFKVTKELLNRNESES